MGVPDEPATPHPDVGQALSIQAILGRYQSVRSEIQWRAVQRDALVFFTLTLNGAAYASIDKIGVWVLVMPLLLFYLASIWLHHDRRIGYLAGYILHKIEPALKRFDQLMGLDEYLNEHDPARSFAQRHHFSAIMSRMLFPGLQCLALAVGIGVYVAKGDFSPLPVVCIIGATVVILAITAVTFGKVKHIRDR